MKWTPKEQSINKKIREIAKKRGIADSNRMRIIVALERLVARLQERKFLSENLIFGGGFVLLKTSDTDRFTKDVDAIIKKVPSKKLFEEINKAIKVDLEDEFYFWDLQKKTLEKESGYGGIRFTVFYKTGPAIEETSKLDKYPRIHLDIAMGSEIGVPPVHESLESAIGIFEPISWQIYPSEYIAAEKLHALISRKGESTRAKDVYDLSIILPGCRNKKDLLDAINFIFNARATNLPHSLSEDLKSYDTELLEKVWKKVQFSKKLSFGHAWKKLIDELEKIES